MDKWFTFTMPDLFLPRVFKVFSLLLILSSSPAVWANNGAMQWLHFPLVTAEKGLLPDNISSLAQDHRGFIWIATLNGLYRYDGREFRSFRHDPRDPDSLPNNLITSMILVEDNRLLLGSLQGGLFWFDTKTEVAKPVENQPTINSNFQVQSLFLENNNILWVGSFSGLYRFELDSGKIRHFIHNPLDPFSLPGRLVTNIFRDKAEQLWIGTDSGLAKYNATTDEFIQVTFPGLENQTTYISSLYLDTDDSIWVGTNQFGLFHITDAGARISAVNLHENNVSVRDILRISSGNLWVASDKGIFVIPAYGGEVSNYSYTPGDPLSLADNDIFTLFENEGHLVFIGSTKGLYKSAPQLANFGRIMYTPLSEKSLSHNFVTDITELPDGNVLVSSLNGLDVFQYQNNKITALHIPAKIKLENKKYLAVFVDTKQRIWLGDINGKIIILNRNYKLIKSFVLSKEIHDVTNRVLFIKAQRNGTIWIGSNYKTITIDAKSLEITKQFKVGGNHPLERAPLIDMEEDSHGDLWFGTRGAGIVRYQFSTEKYSYFSHHAGNLDSLSQNSVNGIYIDAHDNIWVATTNGLNKFSYEESLKKEPVFTKWLESDGINDADIRSIILDDSGWLWVATGSGLSRLNLDSNTFENFAENDGLPYSVFTEGAVLKSSQGLLYFGGSNGISVVNPSHFKRNLHRPKIIIDAISLQQGPWIPLATAPFNFNADMTNLRFKISTLDFYQPKYNQIKYRLRGYDSKFFNNYTNPIISFTNLNSGNYQLEVTGTNNDGTQAKSLATFSFSIATPFWFSWWAIIIYLLLPFYFIYLIFRNHNKKLFQERQITEHLRKNDRLKDEFLAVISHELRTPLTGIIGITESLIDGSGGSQNQRTLEGLNLIVNSGQRLSTLVNEILDFKKLTHRSLQIYCRPIDINSVLNVVLAACEPLIGEKPVTLNLQIADDLPAVFADSHRIQQILYNLLGNAIKFTENGRVTLSAQRQLSKYKSR